MKISFARVWLCLWELKNIHFANRERSAEKYVLTTMNTVRCNDSNQTKEIELLEVGNQLIPAIIHLRPTL